MNLSRSGQGDSDYPEQLKQLQNEFFEKLHTALKRIIERNRVRNGDCANVLFSEEWFLGTPSIPSFLLVVTDIRVRAGVWERYAQGGAPLVLQVSSPKTTHGRERLGSVADPATIHVRTIIPVGSVNYTNEMHIIPIKDGEKLIHELEVYVEGYYDQLSRISGATSTGLQ